MFAFCALYRGGDEEVNVRDTLVVIYSTALAVLEVGGRRSVSSAVNVGHGVVAGLGGVWNVSVIHRQSVKVRLTHTA